MMSALFHLVWPRRAWSGTAAQRRTARTARQALWLALSLLLAAAALWWAAQAARQRAQGWVQAAADQVQQQAQREALASERGGNAAGDFVRSLPAQARVDRLVEVLDGVVTQAGVRLLSVQVTPRPAAHPGELPAVELALTLQGGYPALKQVLSDVLARFPEATLVRQGWRRNGTGADVDAQWLLRLWARPVPEGAR